MADKRRLQQVAAYWFVTVLLCISLIAGGILLLTNTIHWPWLDRSAGWLLILIGLASGYYGSQRCFWLLVSWLSSNDFKPKNGRGTKGPRIVVVGGGTGLGTILRGLKEITSNLTAIVTVADDGGSSGRLRKEFGILPPGDIRNCLVAMADIEPLMERLMQYRFAGNTDLAGHNFGNLFLTVMTDITGDFEQAIRESSKVLAVRGQVLPATLENVILKAEMADGSIVRGESAITASELAIRRISLEPENVKPLREAINAIAEADLIILGPGSLYTSVIPNLLVTDLAEALRAAPATKLYVCNAMTQPGETDHYTASDHIRAIIQHAGQGLIDMALINTEAIPPDLMERYAEEGAQPVTADFDKIKALGVTPLGLEVIVKSNLIRHDAFKLAQMVLNLYRTQRLGKAFGKRLSRKIYRFFKGFTALW
ncbi:putative cofD-like protein [Hydrogenispora ethanolica]|jgi:uncharacterized cofD-like protein|uniref:Putative gluconeogenesis factor n=1 Tax=Hydrogenispora ethanolica TaxID=1082276 RepID=A0A4V2QGC2_HYDET|nr:uridine diphosphate-N-acetylglucosamine-binding protein YvcK [Hydrogenispora ethanolica]TCL75267.1 putative cofD-like protein [Hydrogenispora ethanolica]